MVIRCMLLLCILIIWPTVVTAQDLTQSNVPIAVERADLEACISYAFANHPLIKQLEIRDRITRKTIATELSGWLPQIEANANYQHYLMQPVSIFPDFTNPDGPKREVTTGVVNTSALQIGATQIIYSPDVVIAGTSAKAYKIQSLQSNHQQLIQLVINISKAFYNVLQTEARLNLFLEDRARIERSLKDAFSLYETGLNDKIDYQRARIALNNIDAEIAGTREEIQASYASLKEFMGLPSQFPLVIKQDSNIFEKAWLDTTEKVNPRDRIEYQLLQTRMMLQHSSINYFRLQMLPTVSAFANYNLVYQNDDFSALYNRDFPNSAAGLRVTLPLFKGGRRLNQLKIARLTMEELTLDRDILTNRINTEFEAAMASYKSNLKMFDAARENAAIADGIYQTVRLQYNQGIKSFLEVIVSETDLRTARINELNALYRLIASKIDVEAALGRIEVNY